MNCLYNSVYVFKELLYYFEDRNKIESRTSSTFEKSFNTSVSFATTSISVTYSVTSYGLVVTPKSTGVACAITISNKMLFDLVMGKYKKHENCYDRAEEQNRIQKNFDK